MGPEKEIVRRVEALFKLADKIEERVRAATKRADKLTESILARAFRGELVRTEAELARREGRTYEPASELLDRIRAEREENLRGPQTWTDGITNLVEMAGGLVAWEAAQLPVVRSV